MIKYYNEYITVDSAGLAHLNTCTNDNNPIIIVRDVRSRFLSMYKYWKNGAIDTDYKYSYDMKNKNADVSILEFIHKLKNNKSDLYSSFIWDAHFANTTYWIANADYKNIIIIKYTDDLNEKIQQVINLLGIPNKNIPVPRVNISAPIDDESELYYTEVNNFIEEYFKDDIELLNTIENSPELFKFVI